MVDELKGLSYQVTNENTLKHMTASVEKVLHAQAKSQYLLDVRKKIMKKNVRKSCPLTLEVDVTDRTAAKDSHRVDVTSKTAATDSHQDGPNVAI